jgi:hypothetical protein
MPTSRNAPKTAKKRLAVDFSTAFSIVVLLRHFAARVNIPMLAMGMAAEVWRLGHKLHTPPEGGRLCCSVRAFRVFEPKARIIYIYIYRGCVRAGFAKFGIERLVQFVQTLAQTKFGQKLFLINKYMNAQTRIAIFRLF